MRFPKHRARRLRKSETIRRMVRETKLWVDDLIYPLFVVAGKGIKEPINSMPGNFHYSVDMLSEEIKEISLLNIPAVILFGLPENKDPYGSEAYKDDGIIQNAIKEIKNLNPELVVISDVCMCGYTDHGHCGIVKNGHVDNDSSLEVLARIALSYAKAGADVVAPSDMMDGRVAVIRKILDENGFHNVLIMSYAAKYASAFYGPFREAADSAPKFGDRKTYQMDPANAREAEKEVLMDVEEGADIIMVKPALSYLDIIYRVKQLIKLPVAAYNVSGEFAMVKAAGEKGWIDETQVMLEMLTSIKRAGADLILTYFAKEVAKILLEGI